MNISEESSAILAKITDLVKKVQSFLQEVGCSDKQKADFFATKIFQSPTQMKEHQSIHDFNRKCISNYLKTSQQTHGSLRISLIHILTKLEIEHGLIEKYQSQLEQQKLSSKLLQKHRELLNEEVIYRPRKLFDMSFLREDLTENNAKMVKDLDQIKSFQRELQQSLMKTKLLKRMIQQRIVEEMEEPFNRNLNVFQKLLTLESSG